MTHLDAIREFLVDIYEDDQDELHHRASEALDSLQLENTLRDEGLTSGVLPSAIPDVLRRGLSIFRVDPRGEVLPKNGDYSTHRPHEPLSVREWIDERLRVEAPHLFGRRT